MVRTQVQLTSEQVGKLKELAIAYDVSMAELIRRSVDDFLSARRPINAEERKRRALAVIGRFRSGLNAVSVDHDRYLTEIYAGAANADNTDLC
jgi:predicted transcriptional regulator